MHFIAILAVLCYTDSNVTAEGKAGGISLPFCDLTDNL